MKPKKRQKLCSHCDGEVDLEVIVCPFCAADLREEKPERERRLYPSARILGDEGGISSPLYPEREEEKEEGSTAVLAPSQNTWMPIIFFTIGIQCVLFGLFTLLFSKSGSVVLSWNASFWFIYCLIGGPLLYFGYQKL
jgi:hypothetical protein